MKRFHIHIAINDLEENIRFYTALFQTEPSVLETDYAKWMLDDPHINFAISNRGQKTGIDHLGIQVESGAELEAVQQGLTTAALPIAPKNRLPAVMPNPINTGQSILKVSLGRPSTH